MSSRRGFRQERALGPSAKLSALLLTVCALACATASIPAPAPDRSGPAPPDAPFVVVLGTAQDAGYPQAGCARSCCRAVREGRRAAEPVVSLGLVDPGSRRFWLFEATPDFTAQLARLEAVAPVGSELAGVFLTHAHVGHYTGLIHLGREAMGAREVPVYAMPRMRRMLAGNAPWSQLVELGNVRLEALAHEQAVELGGGLAVRPFLVPHRDELSETVGFSIEGPRRRLVFLPDIDKWERWQRPLAELVASADRLYLDATFYAEDELPGRDMSEIPHPYVPETMALLAPLPAAERAKVRFIHFNHTNALLDPGGPAERRVRAAGFGVARTGDRFGL